MADACPRCGHDQVHDLPASERFKKLVPGMKPKRTACGALVGDWHCPCLSMFHVGVGASHSA